MDENTEGWRVENKAQNQTLLQQRYFAQGSQCVGSGHSLRTTHEKQDLPSSHCLSPHALSLCQRGDWSKPRRGSRNLRLFSWWARTCHLQLSSNLPKSQLDRAGGGGGGAGIWGLEAAVAEAAPRGASGGRAGSGRAQGSRRLGSQGRAL